MRLTDEMLSRILSEHDASRLIAMGQDNWVYAKGDRCKAGCIVQVALNEPSKMRAMRRSPKLALQFDQLYLPYWSPETFLRAIAEWGKKCLTA